MISEGIFLIKISVRSDYEIPESNFRKTEHILNVRIEYDLFPLGENL